MLTRFALTVALAACAAQSSAEPAASADPAPAASVRPARRTSKPADAVLRKELSPAAYEITQQEGTEPAFENAYWNNHAAGIYVDVVTGEPLFSSTNKFDSGTGWPSFYQTIAPGVVSVRHDSKYGWDRTEVRSKVADSHLGHVFDDGPRPTGLRYCINSASLRFVPAADLEKLGYGEYKHLFVK